MGLVPSRPAQQWVCGQWLWGIVVAAVIEGSLWHSQWMCGVAQSICVCISSLACAESWTCRASAGSEPMHQMTDSACFCGGVALRLVDPSARWTSTSECSLTHAEVTVCGRRSQATDDAELAGQCRWAMGVVGGFSAAEEIARLISQLHLRPLKPTAKLPLTAVFERQFDFSGFSYSKTWLYVFFFKWPACQEIVSKTVVVALGCDHNFAEWSEQQTFAQVRFVTSERVNKTGVNTLFCIHVAYINRVFKLKFKKNYILYAFLHF